jgi:uncharacterized integral membrane protein
MIEAISMALTRRSRRSATIQDPIAPETVDPTQTGPTVVGGGDGSGLEPLAPHQLERTRASMAWVMICICLVLLLVLIIFIAQNVKTVEVSFLSFHGHFPLAAALLAAAGVGALIVVILGTTRIVQLRRTAVVHRRQDQIAATPQPVEPVAVAPTTVAPSSVAPTAVAPDSVGDPQVVPEPVETTRVRTTDEV